MYALTLRRKDAFGFTPDYEPMLAELYDLRDRLSYLEEEAREAYRQFERDEAELYAIFAVSGDADDKRELDALREQRIGVANDYEAQKAPIESRIAELERTLTAAGYSV